MTWKNSVCMPNVPLVTPNVNLFVEEIVFDDQNAIDTFYAVTSNINSKCNPDFITANGNVIVGLMLVGLISATENYFRDILGYILSVCPHSQTKSVEQKIQLGSLLWGSGSVHNKTAFEFMAFSNAKNLFDTFNSFLDHRVEQHGAWKSWLNEYDKLCELRHAIVHSGNIIAGKNAIKLGLKKNKKTLRVKIDYANLQNASLICTSMVQSANVELFAMLVKRWAEDWRRVSNDAEVTSEKMLISIRNKFLSKRDKNNKAIPAQLTNQQFVNAVKVEFGL